MQPLDNLTLEVIAMSISPAVERFVKAHGVEYEVIQHPAAFTAMEEAAAAHVSGQEWAKTVVVLTPEGEAIQAVLPASFSVDLGRLEKLVRAGALRLAEEKEFVGLYPDCELGAMPPLGNLYHQKVFVDRALAADETIVFDAGDHQSALRMRYADYEKLVSPIVGEFGRAVGA